MNFSFFKRVALKTEEKTLVRSIVISEKKFSLFYVMVLEAKLVLWLADAWMISSLIL